MLKAAESLRQNKNIVITANICYYRFEEDKIMELFKARVVPDKKLCRRAASAFVHKSKTMKAYLIVGLILSFAFGPILTYFAYINHYIDFIVVPTLGIIFLVVYFLAPVFAGKSIYRSQSKKNLTKEAVYSFTEENFRISTVDSSSIYEYSAIEELYETEDLICLFFNKASAFTIPKESIENPLCDVRMFLESKVGKKFIYVKNKSTGKAVGKSIGIVVASIAVAMVAWGIADFQLDEPQTFSYKSYSITADRHLTEWEDNQYNSYSLISSDITLTVDNYTQDDIDYELEKEKASLEDFTKYYCEDGQVKFAKKINHYTYNVSYYDSDDGFDYYNAVCIQQIDGEYWITHIYCDKELEESYSEKFDKWISSITVSPQNV